MKEQLVLRRGTPVYIEWDDSASYGGWRPDADGMRTGKVKSVGFVFGVNEEGIILATSLARAPEIRDVVALDPVMIPHGCIRVAKVLDLSATETPTLQLEGVMVKEAMQLEEDNTG